MNTVMGSTYTPKEKFIVVSETMAVISDYNFYMRNKEEIETWIEENCYYAYREGMIIKFPNSEDRTMFLLRWATNAV